MADTPDSLHSTQRDAAIIDPHLPEGYSAEPDALISDPVQVDTRSGVSENHEESSLLLQGGDIHRDIYKIKARANAPRRAATFSGLYPRDADEEQIRADEILQPGGFRRQHVQRNQTEIPNLRRRLSRAAVPVTRNFIGFLELYGDFAGEDLADTDDDESAIDDSEREPLNDDRERPNERRPLLGKRKSTRRLKQQGDATTTKTFFTLLKAFVGTGILFLPKAFRNGGILASSITLVMVSLITCVCFHLLLECRKKCGGGGYGEIVKPLSASVFDLSSWLRSHFHNWASSARVSSSPQRTCTPSSRLFSRAETYPLASTRSSPFSFCFSSLWL